MGGTLYAILSSVAVSYSGIKSATDSGHSQRVADQVPVWVADLSRFGWPIQSRFQWPIYSGIRRQFRKGRIIGIVRQVFQRDIS